VAITYTKANQNNSVQVLSYHPAVNFHYYSKCQTHGNENKKLTKHSMKNDHTWNLRQRKIFYACTHGCICDQLGLERYPNAKLKCKIQDRNQKFISGVGGLGLFFSYPFHPFSFSAPFLKFLPFTLSSPATKWPPQIRIFGVFRAQGTCLVAANNFLFLLNKI